MPSTHASPPRDQTPAHDEAPDPAPAAPPTPDPIPAPGADRALPTPDHDRDCALGMAPGREAVLDLAPAADVARAVAVARSHDGALDPAQDEVSAVVVDRALVAGGGDGVVGRDPAADLARALGVAVGRDGVPDAVLDGDRGQVPGPDGGDCAQELGPAPGPHRALDLTCRRAPVLGPKCGGGRVPERDRVLDAGRDRSRGRVLVSSDGRTR